MLSIQRAFPSSLKYKFSVLTRLAIGSIEYTFVFSTMVQIVISVERDSNVLGSPTENIWRIVSLDQRISSMLFNLVKEESYLFDYRLTSDLILLLFRLGKATDKFENTAQH